MLFHDNLEFIGFQIHCSGWQTHALSDGSGVRSIDARKALVASHLGVMGMPGFTAYAGLLALGQHGAGETV